MKPTLDELIADAIEKQRLAVEAQQRVDERLDSLAPDEKRAAAWTLHGWVRRVLA